ncbi:VOC family protein [Dysgonomonas reticulitermitis]
MKIKSYLSFNGNAEEALNFYAGVFNGTIGEIYRYGEWKEMESPADYKDKIIHSCLSFNGCTISVADTMPGTKADFGSLGHTITIFCDTEQQLNDIYTKLPVGGQIKCELCQPGYAKLYAEILDKFGVLWALIIE